MFVRKKQIALVASLVLISIAGQAGADRPASGSAGIPPLLLARAAEVQAELALSPEQANSIESLADQLRSDSRQLMRENGREFRQLRLELESLHREASLQLAALLNDSQRQRFQQIVVGVNGVRAIADPIIAEELVIDDAQRHKLAQIREETIQEMTSAFSENRSDRHDGRKLRERIRAVRSRAEAKMLDVLSPEQTARLEALKGDPLDIDMTQFRRSFHRHRGDRLHAPARP